MLLATHGHSQPHMQPTEKRICCITVGVDQFCLCLYDASCNTGSSVNWNCQLPLLSAWAAPVNKASAAAGAHEATLAATGRKLGAAKKVPSGSNTKTRSRLCSAAMFERWLGLLSAVPQLQLLPSSLHEQDSCPAGPEAADSTRSQFTICTYRRRKQQDGQKYQAAWAALRQGPSVFAKWLHKW
eukprot:GHUV01030906.1.p1 GENE.GHUV01030906.1~~GHUV01030906.1.p1  ORF type:complete len:184 (+),score=30.61 GHUV01030906.1:320-871(+)